MTLDRLADPGPGAAGTTERYATILGGTALAFAGLRRGGWLGTALAATGGGLLLAGAAGVPVAERMAGRVRGGDIAGLLPMPDREPTTTQANITVACPPEKVFRYWRNFANLPHLFGHLDQVEIEDAKRSCWMARGPGGLTVRWRSEIDKERDGELISWHTVEGAELPHRGSVHFGPAPGGRGTEVRLTIVYRPPGGQGGRAVAALFGSSPERQSREALRRLKQILEAGEVPTVAGQPRGHRRMRELVE